MGLLVGMNTAVIRYSIFELLGGFKSNMRIGEDYDFWLRAACAGRACRRLERDVAELGIEIAVIRGAAELTVGGKPQSDALLQRDRVIDRTVFSRGERCLIDLALREAAAQREQAHRPQQAADMRGAKRREHAR